MWRVTNVSTVAVLSSPVPGSTSPGPLPAGVWPSEEVLTVVCVSRRALFRDKLVLEVGGGMTCLAGITVSLCELILFTAVTSYRLTCLSMPSSVGDLFSGLGLYLSACRLQT